MKKYINKVLLGRGFTLVELLLVISVIAILSSFVIVSIGSARAKARDANRLISLNEIEKAIEMYRDDNGVPPGADGVEYVNGKPDWIPGLVPTYMTSLPSDPQDSGAHKFHYTRQGADFAVIALVERELGAATDDGGVSPQYLEKSSGPFLEISNQGEKEWRFASTSELVYLTCSNQGEQVTICHKTDEGNSGNTLTVSCQATGPQGHSNHEFDTLGSCAEEGEETTALVITASGGSGGTISPSGAMETTAGANATFTITPDSGYSIASVVVDGVDQGAVSSYTFTAVETAHTISATFSADTPAYHSFSITSGPNGTITSTSTSVAHGGNITFSIIPNAGYQVAGFTIDGVSAGTPTTYTFTNVSADHAINATFSPVAPLCPVTLTPSLSSYTSGTPVQITWDKTCYPSTRVLLEIRKMTGSGSTSFIMIYSAASNTGTYPYQGFPSGTIGSENWVIRVTNDNPRTILNESAQFTVTAP